MYDVTTLASAPCHDHDHDHDHAHAQQLSVSVPRRVTLRVHGFPLDRCKERYGQVHVRARTVPALSGASSSDTSVSTTKIRSATEIVLYDPVLQHRSLRETETDSSNSCSSVTSMFGCLLKQNFTSSELVFPLPRNTPWSWNSNQMITTRQCTYSTSLTGSANAQNRNIKLPLQYF